MYFRYRYVLARGAFKPFLIAIRITHQHHMWRARAHLGFGEIALQVQKKGILLSGVSTRAAVLPPTFLGRSSSPLRLAMALTRP